MYFYSLHQFFKPPWLFEYLEEFNKFSTIEVVNILGKRGINFETNENERFQFLSKIATTCMIWSQRPSC